MACFVATIAEAAVVSTINKIQSKTVEKKALKLPEGEREAYISNHKQKVTRKISWLSYMLWGGSLLLAFEHVWHGEVTPWFPFLTAASSPESTVEMLKEIATAGTGMCVAVTAVWGIMLLVSNLVEKKQEKKVIETK